MGSQGPGTHTSFMAATMHLRLDPNSRLHSNIERANAFRPVYFMRRKRHEIHLYLFQIDFNLARALRRIDMKHDAALPGNPTDCLDIIHYTNLVVHVHQ